MTEICIRAIFETNRNKEIFTGARGDSQIRVDLTTDSQSLIDSVNSTKQIEEKLLRPIIKYLKQCLDAQMINDLRWCDTTVCLADIFTKSSAPLIDTFLRVVTTNEMIDLKFST